MGKTLPSFLTAELTAPLKHSRGMINANVHEAPAGLRCWCLRCLLGEKAGPCEPARGWLGGRLASPQLRSSEASEHLLPRNFSKDQCLCGPGPPHPPLESAQSQSRVSQQSLWLDLVPKSLVAFSKLGTRWGFKMQAHRGREMAPLASKIWERQGMRTSSRSGQKETPATDAS